MLHVHKNPLTTLVAIVLSSLLLVPHASASRVGTSNGNIECSEYLFLGLSGSGQKSDKRESGIVRELGPELASLFGNLKSMEQFQGSIKYDPIDEYKALGLPVSILNSRADLDRFLENLISNGAESLHSRFKEYEKSCPESKFIIAGYSQGAFAANQFINQLEKNDPNSTKNILGVILLANPAQPETGVLAFLESQSKRTSALSSFASSLWSLVCRFLKLTSLSGSCEKLLKSEKLEELLGLRVSPLGSSLILSHHAPRDVIADTTNAFSSSNITREISESRGKNSDNSRSYANRNLIIDLPRAVTKVGTNAIQIHSSYCAPNGEFAPRVKQKRQTCNSATNGKFLTESRNFLRNRIAAGG